MPRVRAHELGFGVAEARGLDSRGRQHGAPTGVGVRLMKPTASVSLRRVPHVRIEQAQVVKAPREQVFQAWTDCEAWPTWDPVVFTRVTVTERAGNTVHLDAEVKVMGLRIKRTERHVLTPPEKVEVEGGIRGMTNTTQWKFEAVPEGTMVTAVGEVQLTGPLRLLGALVKWQGQAVLREWMRAFADYVESK